MAVEPSVPKNLQHLLEKREKQGRRVQDRVKSAASRPPDGAERRRSQRRKPNKPGKA
jgi:hypothetical protein